MKTLTDLMTALLKTVKLIAHPVGSIYISTVETSPEELFGGTWEQVQDTFLWCAGTNHPAGTTGGEETHTLTEEEMPSHTHQFHLSSPRNGTSGSTDFYVDAGTYGEDSWNVYWTTNPTGGNTAHNNMPPYLAVYAWKRVA